MVVYNTGQRFLASPGMKSWRQERWQLQKRFEERIKKLTIINAVPSSE